MLKHEKLTENIIGAAIDVHRALGPGLLESAYELCLCKELELRGLQHEKQVELPVKYKGLCIESSYRADVIVENSVLLELKSAKSIIPIHEAQLLTYMRLSGIEVGLLMNFNVVKMVDGIERRVL